MEATGRLIHPQSIHQPLDSGGNRDFLHQLPESIRTACERRHMRASTWTYLSALETTRRLKEGGDESINIQHLALQSHDSRRRSRSSPPEHTPWQCGLEFSDIWNQWQTCRIRVMSYLCLPGYFKNSNSLHLISH